MATGQPVQDQSQPRLDIGSTPDSIAFAPAGPSESSAQVQPSEQIQRKSFLPTALPLAFLASLFSIWYLPFGLLVLVAAVAWGTLRHQRRYADHVSAGMGARQGALMGVLTYVFALLLATLAFALTLFFGRNSSDFRDELIKQIQQAATRAPDPQSQAIMQWFTTNEGLIVLVALGLVFLFILFLVSATATGAVVGAMGNKNPQSKP